MSATFTSGGRQVAGTQNDISFAAPLAVAAKANGKPDCAVNGAINKGATSFAFRPNGCNGAACTSIRALVLSTNNVDPIPTGSVLYTCKVNIAPTALSGRFPLAISGVILFDRAGNQVAGSTGTDGQITVGTVPPLTQTPTTTPIVSPLSIEAGTASGARGQQVTFNVILHTQGALVAGTLNDITYDPANVPIAAKANGKPDCTVNGAIDKGATSFAFRPNGCTGAFCTIVRALVLSTDNVTPISNGAVLYTCKVNIAAGAPNGQYPLSISGVILSHPAGNQVPGATGVSGSIVVTGAPTPTATPSPISPRVAINVGTTAGTRGQLVTFGVTLTSGGVQIAGAQNDISFDPVSIPIAATSNGTPDCTVNPDINKQAPAFAFLPPGCQGTACTRVRAIVVSLLNSDPIPDGSVLYTCNVLIGGNAAFTSFPLTTSHVVASDVAGNAIPVAGTNGSVLVTSIRPTPTPTPLARPIIAVGSATGLPNHHVAFSVTLDAMGATLAAAQVDVAFDPLTPIDSSPDGGPNCVVNAAINKGASSFRFQPANCTPGVTCGAVRAIIIAFDNVDPIADGAVLFSCSASIKRTALPQPYPLTCSGPQGTDPSAHRILATCADGSITVLRPCPGDCNADGEVTIDELLTGVNIGLGGVSYDQCPSFDTDINRTLTIDELLQGVLDALNGCPMASEKAAVIRGRPNEGDPYGPR